LPAPPARIRSASVPCGTNSTSSSPDRNWRSNSAFSPTYDDTILRICFVCSSSPRPQSSTPALLETHVKFLTPSFTSALIRFSGIPHNPKPPTTSVAPFWTSRTASSADATTLLITAGRYHCTLFAYSRRTMMAERSNPYHDDDLSGNYARDTHRGGFGDD